MQSIYSRFVPAQEKIHFTQNLQISKQQFIYGISRHCHCLNLITQKYLEIVRINNRKIKMTKQSPMVRPFSFCFDTTEEQEEGRKQSSTQSRMCQFLCDNLFSENGSISWVRIDKKWRHSLDRNPWLCRHLALHNEFIE